MAKAYGEDYLRNFLSTYEQGYGTLEELAADFRVSLGWAKKVSAAYTRTGSMAQPSYQPGRKPKIGSVEQALLRQWLQEQPDLTLVELQLRLNQQAQVQIHISCLCRWLKRMGERLKKSRSTRRNATLPRT
jgi:transposase